MEGREYQFPKYSETKFGRQCKGKGKIPIFPRRLGSPAIKVSVEDGYFSGHDIRLAPYLVNNKNMLIVWWNDLARRKLIRLRMKMAVI